MAETKNVVEAQGEKGNKEIKPGFVRVKKLTPEGGTLEISKKHWERLEREEARLGVKFHELEK